MIRQTPGRIYLADQRGLTETSQYRRYSTFNFPGFEQEYKEPFGPLLALNDETLAGGHRLELTAPVAGLVLVLPITGAVGVAAPSLISTVQVEEAQLVPLAAGAPLSFTNLYETELIRFLHIWLTADSGPASATHFTFSFDALTNHLQEIAATDTVGFTAHLGRFGGRQQAVYQLRRPGSRFFAFVLAGAFEIEGRLLHEQDGLALWDTAEVELEALSNNALVLALEF